MSLPGLPVGGCAHVEVLPYGDGRYGECTACGDRTFPIEDPFAVTAEVRARVVAIRERLDLMRARGLAIVSFDQTLDDLEWLLAEHKRLRRGSR